VPTRRQYDKRFYPPYACAGMRDRGVHGRGLVMPAKAGIQ